MPPNTVSRRQSSLYDAFDTITEPGRRSQPAFMRRNKTRRSKTAIILAVLCTLLLIWGWRGSGIDIIPNPSRFKSTKLETSAELLNAPDHANTAETPLMDPGGLDKNTSQVMESRPAFHLLVPATESKLDLCKTLLTAFVLGYPAPTLINWGKTFSESKDDWAESHMAKIKGVHDFLNDNSKVKDDDLVLIIDGYDVWFQLPAQILIERYHAMIETADHHLKNRYGMVQDIPEGDSPSQKYQQRVMFGADKICWPNPKEDPACAAVPYSTLPKDAYGPETDRDPESFRTRPRWLNSGNVLGPASNIRDIYSYALQKLEKDHHRGDLGDQLIFGEIFGEQEFQRETQRIASQSTPSQWMDWISSTLGNSESPLAANITINNMTVTPGQRYEYSIGLDYESRLFQTMTHSVDDVAFIIYNSSDSLTSIQAANQALRNLPLFLPSDLQVADPPCTFASPGMHTEEATGGKKTLLLPYSPTLDTLPADPSDPAQPSWREVPLATNIHAASVPVLLHINGDKSVLEDWWPNLWSHKYARALLRRFIRSTQSPHAAESASKGGETWWDTRGGRGGVWTDNGEWKNWAEVCKGHDDKLFMDGKGVFGKEEGDGKVVNAFGKTLVGDDEDK